jgi:transposase InsO family protein
MTPGDDFTRECLGLVVDTSLTGLRLARELDRIAELRGYPCMSRAQCWLPGIHSLRRPIAATRSGDVSTSKPRGAK